MQKKHVRKTAFVCVAFMAFFTGLYATSFLPCARAQRSLVELYPETPDPFVGNWQGRWSGDVDVDPDVAAQVVAQGRGKYLVRLTSKLFMRSTLWELAEAEAKDGVLQFKGEEYKGEIRDGKFTGGRNSGSSTFSMSRILFAPPALGAAPPANAEVLFDGANFDAWEGVEGWVPVDDNAMMVTPDASDLVSKKKYSDVQLHVEFRLPFMPKERGQSRGNSGVFVQEVYEVQVLDSFGLEGYYDDCGALYKVSPPRVNACLPPTEWQTYDITYHAARFNEDGTVKSYPRMTVLHNGFVIQQDQEIPQITAWKEVERLQPPPAQPGSIKLQSHRNHYVQFRNVWVVDLGTGV
ncbi:MAG TPA: DUF1080 domain-containing protein [Candidatus Hydrogenedentes bacterium]|nr:DUF1080 domain-containing protein [Candidatus Hydrogenedentota bacterium]